MADSDVAKWEISPDKPDGFKEKYVSLLELKYEINEKGQFVFAYRAAMRLLAESERLRESIVAQPFKIFFDGEDYIAEIDIDIKYGDTIVYVETVDEGKYKDLYWSQVKPAIKTKKKRTKIYGHLHYQKDTAWTTSLPSDYLCRRIFFKARYNRNISSDKKHGFSFNVLIRGKELEVDPDIRNPSAN